MTIKFLKQWGRDPESPTMRALIQADLDGGLPIVRAGATVEVGKCFVTVLSTPGEAVRFAAALNKLRRPLHLIKQDLDQDWSRRVKERDTQTCLLCGVQGDVIGRTIPAHDEEDEETGVVRHVKERTMKDVLTAHHWLKTKARAGMARWARACGITVHFAEHIHRLHENPCWADLEPIYRHVVMAEGEDAIRAALRLATINPDEKLVRALWYERGLWKN